MQIKDLLNYEQIELLNEGNLDNVIHKIFASDLMSHVMGFAEESDLLITVLNNINVLGVASLLDFSGVLFTHDIKVNQAILDKANELEIPVLKTHLTTVEAVILLRDLGK